VLVTRAARQLDPSLDAALLVLFGAIASHDDLATTRNLEAAPDLATRPICTGASRQDPDKYFLAAIHHYVYAGDTALHIAAAAHNSSLAQSLVARGADVRARNRRGAEPIHYAADGSPATSNWSRDSQRDLITYLIEAGADPDAMDNSGVAALHGLYGIVVRAPSLRSSHTVQIRV
jgi:ankyrin repeat protein